MVFNQGEIKAISVNGVDHKSTQELAALFSDDKFGNGRIRLCSQGGVDNMSAGRNTVEIKFVIKPTEETGFKRLDTDFVGEVPGSAESAMSPYPHFDINLLDAKANFLLVTPSGWKVETTGKDVKEFDMKDGKANQLILKYQTNDKMIKSLFEGKEYKLFEFAEET